MKKSIIYLSILILATFSCKDRSADDPISTQSTKGTVEIHAEFEVNGKHLETDSVYTDGSGTKYKISLANVYLSKLAFETSGTTTALPNEYVLLKHTSHHYELGKVEKGAYTNLNFNVGIDSVTNHSDPNIYPATSPLYPQTPSMHWTWNSGYIFYKIEGKVDSANDGTFSKSMAFHIGTDGLIRNGSVPVNLTVDANATSTINMVFDLDALFSGVDLSTENVSHTMDNKPLATKLSNNIVNAISVE